MKFNSLKHLVLRLFAFFVVSVSCNANAGLIFESAQNTAPTTGSGLGVDNHYFAMHRFFLNDTYTLSSVGGYFEADRNRNVFAAIVGLNDQDDFPDSIDLSTPDVIGTTLVNIGTSDDDYFGNISLTLQSGWYALAFGAGKFGADSMTDFDGVILLDVATDLSNDLPITAINASNPFNVPEQFTYQSGATRFVVNGQLTNQVSEPAVAVFLIMGLLGSIRRKSTQR